MSTTKRAKASIIYWFTTFTTIRTRPVWTSRNPDLRCSCVISSVFSLLPHYIEYANALFILLYLMILLLRLPNLLQNPCFLLWIAPAVIANSIFNGDVVRGSPVFSENYTEPLANRAMACCLMNNYLYGPHYYASSSASACFSRHFPAIHNWSSPTHFEDRFQYSVAGCSAWFWYKIRNGCFNYWLLGIPADSPHGDANKEHRYRIIVIAPRMARNAKPNEYVSNVVP